MTDMDAYTGPEFHRAALLGIDMQNDFLAPGGSRYRQGAEEIVPKAARLAALFQAAGRPVVHVVRLYAPDGSDAEPCRKAALLAGESLVLPGSRGALPVAGLGIPEEKVDADALRRGRILPLGRGAHLMYKPSWSAFFHTPLDGFLRGVGVSTVVLMGAFFPNCVRSTAMEAASLGYRVVMVPEAVAGVHPQGLRELEAVGVAMASVAQAGEMLETAEP